jgi:hypothetical protein
VFVHGTTRQKGGTIWGRTVFDKGKLAALLLLLAAAALLSCLILLQLQMICQFSFQFVPLVVLVVVVVTIAAHEECRHCRFLLFLIAIVSAQRTLTMTKHHHGRSTRGDGCRW